MNTAPRANLTLIGSDLRNEFYPGIKDKCGAAPFYFFFLFSSSTAKLKNARKRRGTKRDKEEFADGGKPREIMKLLWDAQRRPSLSVHREPKNLLVSHSFSRGTNFPAI